MQPHESWHNVGMRIRYLRKTHGLTLKQLAAGCNLSTNAISLIERGEVAPTVATLCKIATALGASASSFLQEICPSEVVLMRAQDAQPSEPTPNLAGGLVEAALFKGCSSDFCQATPMQTSVNRQYALCLCGKIEFEDNDCQSHLLHPGDRLFFNGNANQRWHNPTGDSAIVILVIPGQSASNPLHEVE